MKKIDKPWGYELIFAETKHYAGKVLVIYKGEELSLQYHRHKEETIYVSHGRLEFILGKETRILNVGDSAHIPPGVTHRMKAVEDCEIFEVSTPELHDVVRLEDHYGRV